MEDAVDDLVAAARRRDRGQGPEAAHDRLQARRAGLPPDLEVESQLEQKGVTLTLDDAARRWIAEKGYDPKMGARPMARTIQEHIKRPLAEELLFGRLTNGGYVRVSVTEDGTALTLTCEPSQVPAVPAQATN